MYTAARVLYKDIWFSIRYVIRNGMKIPGCNGGFLQYYNNQHAYTFRHLGCTYAVPKFQADEIPAFSSKLLQEVITRRETNKKHLDFVVHQMPESTCRVPFDTSSIELSDVLKKLKAVISREFVQKMLDMGMRVKTDDIRKAIELLPDESAPLLELIISRYQEPCASYLNLLCQDALDAKKLKFVAAFITRGAKPSPDKIKQLIGWPPLPGRTVSNVVLQYLATASEIPQGGPSQVGDMFGGAVPPPVIASSQVMYLTHTCWM